MNKLIKERLKSKVAVFWLVVPLLVGKLLWDGSLVQDSFFNAGTFGAFGEKISFSSLPKNKKQQEERQDFWITLPDDFRPENHNSTVDGRPIPGPFWDDKLLLIGARLTTSYEDDEQSVHATLFGMGGFYRKNYMSCETNELNGENGTLWTFQRIVEETNVLLTLGDEKPDPLSSAISMEHVLTNSFDGHVDNTTLIWSADLGPFLTKEDLRQQVAKSTNKAIRLQFWIQGKTTQSGVVPMLWPLSVVDIPLSTGVVGHGGPQIRHSTASRSLQISSGSRDGIDNEGETQQPHHDAPRVHPAGRSQSALLQPPVDAALCITVHGEQSLDRLPEFITHHTNVGFDQIIVGIIDSLMDGDMIRRARGKLQDFIDDGTVNLAVAGLPLLECHRGIPKIHFYTACLYHAKGVAEYVGTWDLDEYWVPPQLPDGKASGWDHELRPRSPLKTSDEIWKKSPYQVLPSIGQVMKYIHAYHAQVGCAELWCFHAMPSTYVYLRRDKTGAIADRAGVIHKDFELRTVSLNKKYRKSIARTKYVNMNGFHEPGSCRFSPKGNYTSRLGTKARPRGYSTDLRRVDDDETCHNLRLNTEEYGVMHHFFSLNLPRDDGKYICDGDNALCKQDEYIELFGKTIEQQLSVNRTVASK